MDLLQRPRRGYRLLPLHGGLIRVLGREDAVAGYIESVDDAGGTRYRAKRMRPRAQGFVELGEFWSIDDALDALRFG